MKKLITTALLFAGLTINAQSNFIENLNEKYETIDTTYEDGVYFTPKGFIGFLNENDIEDTIFIWFVVNYDIDYNLKLKSICLQSSKNYTNRKLFKDIKFVFENKTLNFNLSKELFSQLEDAYYLTTNDKCKVEYFDSRLKSIKLKDKTYITDKNQDLYFQYFLAGFEYLKFDWIN
jgi:hypothetical protein